MNRATKERPAVPSPSTRLLVVIAALTLAVAAVLTGPMTGMASAVGSDATETTVTISPSGSQAAGQPVTFTVAVTAGSGVVPTGSAELRFGGSSCGTDQQPDASADLGADGTATFTR
jgi:hypothetical protein